MAVLIISLRLLSKNENGKNVIEPIYRGIINAILLCLFRVYLGSQWMEIIYNSTDHDSYLMNLFMNIMIVWIWILITKNHNDEMVIL